MLRNRDEEGADLFGSGKVQCNVRAWNLEINTLVKGGTEFTTLVCVKVEAIQLTNQGTPIDGKSVGMMA